MTPPPILVTGAAGYLGQALVAALAADGLPVLATDLAAPPDARPGFQAGDLTDPAWQRHLFDSGPATVFHLAGIVSGAAEADFDRGRRVNLDATLLLLEHCRRLADAGRAVTLVYTSSIAVFGAPLPARLDDDTPPAPTLSYGAHKRAIEILLDDYTRRGLVDGRGLRLPGVVVRPPLPNGALSGFNSDLIREPLAGRDYLCPVGPDASLWLSSLPHVIANLRRMATLPAASLGRRRTLNAPALAATVGQLRDAVVRADPAAAARIRFVPSPDPALVAQFGRWPLDCGFGRAQALGLTTDRSLDDLVAAHLAGTRAAARPAPG